MKGTMNKIKELKNELREAKYFYKDLELPLNKDDYKSCPGLYEIDCKGREETLEDKTTYLKSIYNKIRYYTKKYNKELERLNDELNNDDYELEV